MSFRPSAAARIRDTWTRRRPHQRTIKRTATVLCLALGVYGGLSAVAAACGHDSAVSAEQLAATVNRAAAVDGFADAFVTTYLSGAGAAALADYTGARIEPSPVPVTIIKTTPWSTQRQGSGFGNVDYWSVVIGAFVKPVSQPPQLWFYQVPVTVVGGTLRAVTAPSLVNGPGPGYDTETAYPSQVSDGSQLFDTASGFLTSWLTGSGDLTRYSSSPAIRAFPTAPFTQVTITSISADTAIPNTTPADGYTAHILVTATAQDNDMTALTMTYPLAISFREGKWFITDLDLTPKLAGRITAPTATTPTTTTSLPLQR